MNAPVRLRGVSLLGTKVRLQVGRTAVGTTSASFTLRSTSTLARSSASRVDGAAPGSHTKQPRGCKKSDQYLAHRRSSRSGRARASRSSGRKPLAQSSNRNSKGIRPWLS